jgi:5-methylcytosine-specific restriction endonuclease McrA
MLRAGSAAVFRKAPFTIILKERVGGETQPVSVKIDPGSKTTGIVLVADFPSRGPIVVFASEIDHRGPQIKKKMDQRRAFRRRRRSTLRYRKPRFDLQKRENPDISGVEYQQGMLFGYEVREYLLEKGGRTCSYCGAENVPLEIDHVHPRSKGGSDRVSNLTLSCRACNQKKGNRPVEEFLAKRPDVLKRILSRAKAPLKDAAAVNATRGALFESLKATGLPVETGSGGRTKFNRAGQEDPKAHWIDAACVGESGTTICLDPDLVPLRIRAMGHGTRQVARTDRYGFPIRLCPRDKTVFGFRTGDRIRAMVPSGKKAGTHVGRVPVRSSGSFNVRTAAGLVQGISHKHCRLIQRADGYGYSLERKGEGAFLPGVNAEVSNARQG